MAVIFAGTSAVDFTGGSLLSPETFSGLVSEGVALDEGATTATIPTFTPASEVWLSFYAVWTDYTGSVREIVRFSSGATNVASVRVKSSSVFFSLYSGAASLGESASAYARTIAKYDVHLKLHATAGAFEVFRDDVLIVSYYGNTTTIASTVDGVQLMGSYADKSHYAGVILADEDTRTMRFVSMPFTGNGIEQGWLGGYTDINEKGYDDNTELVTINTDIVSTFTKAALPSAYATGYDVKAVVLSARGQLGAGRDLAMVSRVGTVNYPTAALGMSGAGRTNKTALLTLNPATGLPWTVAEIDAAQFGVKSLVG